MADVSLNLIVLRSANIDAALKFYQTLGLTFVQEQHGTGPIHYACEMGKMVLEIYPAEAGTAPDRKSGGATMLGFSVASIDEILAQLSTTIITPPKDSAWGRRAVVLDPDGRAVDLSETKENS
jgi:lactoylglutathione lyase